MNERGEVMDKRLLYERWKDLIYRYLYYHVDPSDLDDVVQDVVRCVLESYDNFEGRSTLKTWVIGVCRHAVLKYYGEKKKRRDRFASVPSLDHTPDDSESPLTDMIRDERIEGVRRVLSGLKEQYREILVLRFMEQLPFAQIAEILGLSSEEACRSRCRRALEEARKRLRNLSSSAFP